MKKIINPKLKPWIIVYSSTFLLLAFFYILTNKLNGLTVITFILLCGICLYFLFQVFKVIELLNTSLILYFPLRLFYRRKKIELGKIKVITFKLDNFQQFSFPIVRLFTKQFPFILDLPVNDMEDVVELIYRIKQEGNPRIKANKFRLIELDKKLKVMEVSRSALSTELG